MTNIDIIKNVTKIAAMLGELGIDFEFSPRSCGGVFYLLQGGDIAVHDGVCYGSCVAETYGCYWDRDDVTRFCSLDSLKERLNLY